MSLLGPPKKKHMQHGIVRINRVPYKSTYRDFNRCSFISEKLHIPDEENSKKLLNGKKRHPKEVEKIENE